MDRLSYADRYEWIASGVPAKCAGAMAASESEWRSFLRACSQLTSSHRVRVDRIHSYDHMHQLENYLLHRFHGVGVALSAIDALVEVERLEIARCLFAEISHEDLNFQIVGFDEFWSRRMCQLCFLQLQTGKVLRSKNYQIPRIRLAQLSTTTVTFDASASNSNNTFSHLHWKFHASEKGSQDRRAQQCSLWIESGIICIACGGGFPSYSPCSLC
jgi:hypothetical protein